MTDVRPAWKDWPKIAGFDAVVRERLGELVELAAAEVERHAREETLWPRWCEAWKRKDLNYVGVVLHWQALARTTLPAAIRGNLPILHDGPHWNLSCLLESQIRRWASGMFP